MNISQVKSFSAENLFRELASNNSARGSTDAEGTVEVKITLVGGAEISGYPVRVDSSNNAIMSTASRMAYFAVGEIQVIEVPERTAAIRLLPKEPDSPPSAPVVTPVPPAPVPVVPLSSPPRSDLRDELAKLNAVVSSKFGITVLAKVIDDPEFDDTGKNQFAEFLDMLRHALVTVGEDPVGEITIQSLEQISIIQTAGQLAVERSGLVMVIAVPFAEPFAPTLSARLQTELELNM